MDDYTAEELDAMPTLSQGQADDLKVEGTDDIGRYRVWLCRVTNRISVERYVATYPNGGHEWRVATHDLESTRRSRGDG